LKKGIDIDEARYQKWLDVNHPTVRKQLFQESEGECVSEQQVEPVPVTGASDETQPASVQEHFLEKDMSDETQPRKLQEPPLENTLMRPTPHQCKILLMKRACLTRPSPDQCSRYPTPTSPWEAE